MTRERIVECAEALFNGRGMQDTSIGDIAAAAGISKGTLFYHFKSKDDLVMEIAFAHIQRVGDRMLALLEEGRGRLEPRELVERFLREVTAATLRNTLHLYLVEEGISRNQRLREALAGKYREWQATLLEALAPIVGDRAALLGPVLLALADGLVIQSALGVGLPPIGEMLTLLLPSGTAAGPA